MANFIPPANGASLGSFLCKKFDLPVLHVIIYKYASCLIPCIVSFLILCLKISKIEYRTIVCKVFKCPGPFSYRTTLVHLNTGLVRYSDPHSTMYQKEKEKITHEHNIIF